MAKKKYEKVSVYLVTFVFSRSGIEKASFCRLHCTEYSHKTFDLHNTCDIKIFFSIGIIKTSD